MLGTEAFDQFVSDHRWLVMTTLRKTGQPSSSIVAYVRDGDELLVSTRKETVKVKTLERDTRVTLCIQGDPPHPGFVTIEGVAVIEYTDLAQQTLRILELVSDLMPLPDDIDHWLESQGRVLIRVKADRVYGMLWG